MYLYLQFRKIRPRVIASWKKRRVQLKKLQHNWAQLNPIGAKLIPVVSNPKFVMGGRRGWGGWVPRTTPLIIEKRGGYDWKNCSTVEHNWSTIDSRWSNPKFAMKGWVPTATPLVIEKRGGYNWKKLQHNWEQLENNWFPLFWIKNSQWGLASSQPPAIFGGKGPAQFKIIAAQFNTIDQVYFGPQLEMGRGAGRRTCVHINGNRLIGPWLRPAYFEFPIRRTVNEKQRSIASKCAAASRFCTLILFEI